MNSLTQNRHITLLCLLAMATIYLYLGYSFERDQFSLYLLCYVVLFASFGWVYKKSKAPLKQLLYISFGLKLLFIVSTPFLSQDFYRFIWDGHMLISGINPYNFTPTEVLNQNIFTFPNRQLLYDGMGGLSASHFTNYPPFNQLFFALASAIGGKSVLLSIVVLRLTILAAEIGVIWIGLKLLKHLKLNSKNILLYALNPLVVIELSGNLHFEGVMLFLILCCVYCIARYKTVLGASFLALAVMTKLIPLLLVPCFYQTPQACLSCGRSPAQCRSRRAEIGPSWARSLRN